MYGMVNKAMEEMVVARYGEATWERIREVAGVEVEVGGGWAVLAGVGARPGSCQLPVLLFRPAAQLPRTGRLEGLMVGLGARFGTPVRVRQLVAKGASADHDEFHVEWAPAA
ncbi:MAG: hypothetical protein IPK12_05590 [Gemmatimonadetes bacterium]|nr:hypothetical protein [Gemmatimonadota bacterium]